jgi:DNA-binding XRE family transcriptional regulator
MSHEEMLKRLGRTIKGLRDEMVKIPRGKFCKQVGISYKHLVNIEEGGKTKLDLPLILKIASGLNMSVAELFCIAEQRADF